MAPRSVEYPWNQPCQAYQTQLTGSPPIYNQETEGEEVDIKMEIIINPNEILVSKPSPPGENQSRTP